ncbi:10591_t:CDS:1, partial [Racocetra fulgida]
LMKNLLSKNHQNNQHISLLYQEINSIKVHIKQLTELPISELKCDNQIYAQRIDPCKLHDPSHGNRSDRRGKSKQI